MIGDAFLKGAVIGITVLSAEAIVVVGSLLILCIVATFLPKSNK